MNFNEMIKILNCPIDLLDPQVIDIYQSINPLKVQANFISYYFLINSEMIDFIVSSMTHFFNTNKHKYESESESESASKSECIDNIILDYIEDIHKNKENFEYLNQLVFYLTPIHRFLSLSGVLLNFRCKLLNLMNPLRMKNKSNIHISNVNDVILSIESLLTEEICLSLIKYLNELSEKDSFNGLAFLKIPISRFSSHKYQIQILILRVLLIISNYSYEEFKPFEGIKSMAVLELLKQENLITFPAMSVIQRVFESLPQTVGFTKTQELIVAMMNDSEIYDLMCMNVRTSVKSINAYSEYFDETLNDLIQRISDESGIYIDWNELKQYFSIRGN